MIFVEKPHPEDVEGVTGLTVRRMRFTNQAEQIAFLRQMVSQYRANQLIREKAHEILEENDLSGRARALASLAIAEWVQENIRYVNEGIETFQSPVRTLTYRVGDCDDFTTLIATMLESIGIKTELVGLEWRGQFRHIFPRAVLKNRENKTVRIPLDATLRQSVKVLTNPVAVSIRRGDKPSILVL